jgi:DNA-binding CsgD family transcriptional regulator
MMDSLPNAAEAAMAVAIGLLDGPGFEAALWDLFRRTVAPDNMIVLAYRDGGPPQVIYTQADQPPVFAALEQTYVAGAYLLDPYYDLHLNRVAAGVYRMRDVVPDAFHRSRYFSEYYEQTTLVDELTFVAYPVQGVSINICLGRDASSAQPFTARQIAACQRIAPIVVALAARHWAAIVPRAGAAGDVASRLILAAQAVHGIRLSPRQAEVALLILRGHSTVSIALRLNVAAQTVKVFRKQVYSRCRISSQAELFALMLPLLKGAL